MKFVLIFLIVASAITRAYNIEPYCGVVDWNHHGRGTIGMYLANQQRDLEALVLRLQNHPVSVWVNDSRFSFPRLPFLFKKDLDLFNPKTQAELLMQSWMENKDKYITHILFLAETNYPAPLLHDDHVDWFKVNKVTDYLENYFAVKEVIAEYIENKTKCTNQPKRKFKIPCNYRHDFDEYQDYRL